MTEGIVVTLWRDHSYPTPEEQVYRFERPKGGPPWSTLAASISFSQEVWEMLGSPEHIRATLRSF